MHENRIESLEQQDHESILIVDGIKPEVDKTLAQSLQRQLNANMDIALKEDEIVTCNFIGKQLADGKPKSLKIRLNDRRLKKKIMKKKGLLRTTDIYVKEYLTPKNNSIFYQSRKAQSYGIFHHVWTDWGRVWTTDAPEGLPVLQDDPSIIGSAISEAVRSGKKLKREWPDDDQGMVNLTVTINQETIGLNQVTIGEPHQKPTTHGGIKVRRHALLVRTCPHDLTQLINRQLPRGYNIWPMILIIQIFRHIRDQDQQCNQRISRELR